MRIRQETRPVDMQEIPKPTLGTSSHDLVARLRAGEELAFAEVVREYHDRLLRFALTFVHSQALAEEVVQETWLAMIRGLDSFAERSNLKTWIFQILANRARSVFHKESRLVPMGNLDEPLSGSGAKNSPSPPAATVSSFWPGVNRPGSADSPDRQVMDHEAIAIVEAAIDRLPEKQRRVVTLHDVEQFTTEEICNMLQISRTHQRVLLHRGRSSIRQELVHAYRMDSTRTQSEPPC